MDFNREGSNSNFFSQFPNRGSLSRTFAGTTGNVGLESSRAYSNHEQSQNTISTKIDNLRKYIRDLSSHRGKMEAKPSFEYNTSQATSSSRLQTDIGKIGGITDKKRNFLRMAGLSRDYSTSLDQSNIMNQSRDIRPSRGFQDFQSPGGFSNYEKKQFSPPKNVSGKFSIFDSSKSGDKNRNLTKTPQQKIREDINSIFNSNSKQANNPAEQGIFSDKKRDFMKNSFTSSGKLFFDDKRENEFQGPNKLQDSSIFTRSSVKKENLQAGLNSSSALDSRAIAANNNISMAGRGKGKEQKKYSADDVIRLQDFLVDTHEQEFNSFSNEFIEELLKLSSIIMFRVKNSNYYKNKNN